jgi:hypothetical protein
MHPRIRLKCLALLLLSCLAGFTKPAPTGALPPEAARRTAQEAVADVLDALSRADFTRLAAHVGEEGLTVSPYVMLDKEDVRLSRAEVARCGEDPRLRLWGHYDGSGDPIEATCGDYFRKLVWDADYRKADEILYNEPRQRGLEPNNNHAFAANGIVVELHFRESPEGVEPYRAWKSLRLVFRRGDQGLSLIAITQDTRTI